MMTKRRCPDGSHPGKAEDPVQAVTLVIDWADNEYDSDEFGMAEADDAEEGGGDEED